MSFNDFDSNRESILDKSYGELIFTKNVWGMNEDGTPFWFWTELETYPCSKEELGIDNSEGKKSRFMPIK